MYFQTVLKNLGINPNEYLNIVNNKAKYFKYSHIYFSDDNKHKLMIIDPLGHKIKFGSSINNDFIIYKLLEKKGQYPKGTADKRRHSYLSRATNIKGEWKKNKYSKNNLAIHILW